jgi:hypothetical protein
MGAKKVKWRFPHTGAAVVLGLFLCKRVEMK